MLALTEEILANQRVRDAAGNELPLHSHTEASQVAWMQDLVRTLDPKTCIEIGLAYGISALAVCEVLAEKEGARFIAIDPYQDFWREVGLLNLERAGFRRFVEFHREFTPAVLPKLLASGLSIDFAYVDASKVFDRVLHDVGYLTEMLRVGGLLAVDDCGFLGVRAVVRYLARWPHLRVHSTHGRWPAATWKVRLASKIDRGIDPWLPPQHRLFRPNVFLLDEELGVHANCVVFEKLGPDQREWDWHAEF